MNFWALLPRCHSPVPPGLSRNRLRVSLPSLRPRRWIGRLATLAAAAASRLKLGAHRQTHHNCRLVMLKPCRVAGNDGMISPSKHHLARILLASPADPQRAGTLWNNLCNPLANH